MKVRFAKVLPLLLTLLSGFFASDWWWRHNLMPELATFPWATAVIVKACQVLAVIVGLLGAYVAYEALVHPLQRRWESRFVLTYKDPDLAPIIRVPTWQVACEKLETGATFADYLLSQGVVVDQSTVASLRSCRNKLSELLFQIDTPQQALPENADGKPRLTEV